MLCYLFLVTCSDCYTKENGAVHIDGTKGAVENEYAQVMKPPAVNDNASLKEETSGDKFSMSGVTNPLYTE